MAHYENHVLCYRNHIVRDAIHVSREGGNLLLSATVFPIKFMLIESCFPSWSEVVNLLHLHVLLQWINTGSN